MLPSLNQIGFDYLEWIVGAVAISITDDDQMHKVIFWAVGGKRDPDGNLIIDPETDFILPLSGRMLDGAFVLSNHNFTLPVTGIPIPFSLFQIRGQFDQDLITGDSAVGYAETQILSIPIFGPLLVLAGLATDLCRKLLATLTYNTRRHHHGTANRCPSGLHVTKIDYRAPTKRNEGWIIAKFSLDEKSKYSLCNHVPGVLLIDDKMTEAVSMDYGALLQTQADAMGNLESITLHIPKGTKLPDSLCAIVMLDVYPFHRIKL
jgi:hypothetical protein